MNTRPARSRLIGLYIGALILTLSVIGRAAPRFDTVKYEWAVYWGPALFLVLFLSERLITRWFAVYPHVYFAIQSLLTIVLLQIEPPFDYFAVQFVMLCIQAVWILPRRSALIWVGALLILLTFGLVASNGLEGIAFALAYITIGTLVTFFGLVTLEAERSRNEAQKLLAELQVANRKLQEYAQQAEELAAIQQRSMLARELHDSVTQTIFSMTLTAQAARMLLEKDPGRVAGQLEHLQELAQNALGEMRSLIQQMRPKSMAEEGLVAALRRHFNERQRNDGLSVDFQVSGGQRLPLACEEGLYRIIQEALNNIVKHAGVKQAAVCLDLREPPYSVTVEDHGNGFEANALDTSGAHIGLASMAERARAIGGVLSVESTPGAGTRIRVDNIRPEEV